MSEWLYCTCVGSPQDLGTQNGLSINHHHSYGTNLCTGTKQPPLSTDMRAQWMPITPIMSIHSGSVRLHGSVGVVGLEVRWAVDPSYIVLWFVSVGVELGVGALI